MNDQPKSAGVDGALHYWRELRTWARLLVDLTWNAATESKAVPSTDWADKIIDETGPLCSRSIGMDSRLYWPTPGDEVRTSVHESAPSAPAAAERGSWRPISEAPKDGTEILVGWVGAQNRIVSRWLKNLEKWSHPFSREPNPPTHWMPLPTPPAEKTLACNDREGYSQWWQKHSLVSVQPDITPPDEERT